MQNDETSYYLWKKKLRLRRVGYQDRVTEKHYEFLTNHFKLRPKTIADIYKDRQQIGLFFKEIKRNLRIRHFVGNTENAVLIQHHTSSDDLSFACISEISQSDQPVSAADLANHTAQFVRHCFLRSSLEPRTTNYSKSVLSQLIKSCSLAGQQQRKTDADFDFFTGSMEYSEFSRKHINKLVCWLG